MSVAQHSGDERHHEPGGAAMKIRRAIQWIVRVACSAALGFTATPAFADSIYYALPAEKDALYGQYSGGHALWLPGIGTDFVFTSENPGVFTEKMDNTATLTGTVVRKSDSGKQFNVSVDFNMRTDTPPPGSPKLELTSSAYSVNGGPIDPDTWHYYEVWGGTLLGLMDYSGAELSFTRTGPAFQVGVGANGKNLLLGGSGWLNWTVLSQPTTGGNLQYTGQGDWNLDFQPVPEPGTILLLGSGLVGLIGFRMQKPRA